MRFSVSRCCTPIGKVIWLQLLMTWEQFCNWSVLLNNKSAKKGGFDMFSTPSSVKRCFCAASTPKVFVFLRYSIFALQNINLTVTTYDSRPKERTRNVTSVGE